MKKDPKSTHILLIEDDIFVADIMKTALTQEGYDVIPIDDGGKACEYLEKAGDKVNLDIILLDLILPTLHGLEILQWIKTHKATEKIPVLILSNIGEQKTLDEGMRLGAVGYLIKANFIPKEIVQKIKEVLKKYDS